MSIMPGVVTIHRVRYTEDEIAVRDDDGNVQWHADPPYDAEHTWTDVYEVSAREAADLLNREGLSFEATGNDWAANPDGSYISNYATGERTEVTAHLSRFPDRVLNAIINEVG